MAVTTATAGTQTELAERAGVAQSVISAYEAGRRQPSLPTLARLIEAAGHPRVEANGYSTMNRLDRTQVHEAVGGLDRHDRRNSDPPGVTPIDVRLPATFRFTTKVEPDQPVV